MHCEKCHKRFNDDRYGLAELTFHKIIMHHNLVN
jgi:hypothetical protein